MLKRIAIIAFFTGCGQLLSIFVLKFISEHADVSELKGIAEIDSLVFFMMNLLALGLQSATMRHIAQTTQWQDEYHDTQSARIMLGLLLMSGALLFFINKYYLIFLIAPVLAWNGDYALYAKGHPIAGSVVAFVRLTIPFSAVLISALYYPDSMVWVYIISLTLVYLATNAYISYFLKTSYVFVPSFKKLRLYIQSLPLGVVTVSLYFLGLGLIIVVPYFYPPQVVAVAFVGLKLYVIFKGVLRIIHQAFIKEMVSYEVCLKVDQLSSLMGIVLASFVLCFPHSFIKLFFGEKYLPDQAYFIFLAIAGLIYSLFSSLTTKAMLEKKDKPYSIIAASAALVAIILCIVFSFLWGGTIQPLETYHDITPGIGFSLLIGEILFVTGMLWLMRRPSILKERMLFLFINLPFALIPLGIGYFWGDKLYTFGAAAALTGALMGVLYYRRFSSPPKFAASMPEKKLTSYLKEQSFQPGIGALFTNPFYLIRLGLYRNMRELAPLLQGKLLDFGCGRKPFENLFNVNEYIGVDMEQTGHDHSNSKVDVFYDGKTLPFADETFDALLCSEVLEHVFDPAETLSEVNRVMKTGSKAIFTVPFCWNEHEVPYDYARYSSFGLKHLLEKHGFRVVELRKSGHFVEVIFQLWALYFFEFFKKFGHTGHVISLFFIIPINLAGILVARLFPKNHSLYFNNIILAEKTTPAAA
ncbi:MAG: methyltransferase domain-containing protein [Chitinophagaceae bacterium]